MSDTVENKYLNNRLKFHTASRVAISTAYSLAQSMNSDGHTVTKQQIWTADDSQFPKNTGDNKTTSDGITATIDLVNVFTNNLTEGNGVEKTDLPNSGGEVWTNTAYPAVTLYRNAVLNAVRLSDNMAWELKVGGNRVMDWVSPTSVKDGGLPVPGYTGIIEASNDNWSTAKVIETAPALEYGWELAKGNWEFVYLSGMVTFHPDYIPSKMGYNKLRITAFAYAGTYLADTLNSMEQHTASNMMSIKPFTFGAGDMTTSGDIKSIVIPGVVFNVFENPSGIVYGDLTYLSGNDAGKTRIDFDWSEVSNVTGSLDANSTFTAMAFVLGNGSPITMLGASAYPFNS